MHLVPAPKLAFMPAPARASAPASVFGATSGITEFVLPHNVLFPDEDKGRSSHNGKDCGKIYKEEEEEEDEEVQDSQDDEATSGSDISAWGGHDSNDETASGSDSGQGIEDIDAQDDDDAEEEEEEGQGRDHTMQIRDHVPSPIPPLPAAQPVSTHTDYVKSAPPLSVYVSLPPAPAPASAIKLLSSTQPPKKSRKGKK